MVGKIVAVSLLSVFGVSAIEFEDDSVVETQYGPIQGVVSSLGRAFTSIPYAAPPIDYLRWQNPRAPESWTDILDTTDDPPGCGQVCVLPSYACPDIDKTQEDCLYLNVFTPPVNNVNDYDDDQSQKSQDSNNLKNDKSGSNLPVMIFIHGGSYISGYGGGWLYNGTNLANINNIIVVTINYRLGILGFLYDPDNQIYGNYGYMDQKFAIEWVYNNIEQFGGDPEAITIFGESAGASSVSLHLIDQDNIKNGPKFRSAIMESNPIGLQLRTIDDWPESRNDFYNHLGCSERSCLLSSSMDSILSSQTEVYLNRETNGGRQMISMPWTPTIIPLSINSSSLLTTQPLLAFQNGEFVSAKHDVNIINGVNNNEGWLFVGQNISKDDYNRKIDRSLRDSEDARKVKEYYSSYLVNSSYSYTLSLIETDGTFICPNHNASALMNYFASNSNTNSKIYMYHFDGTASFGSYLLPATVSQCWTLPCHSAELPFVFRPNFGNLVYKGDENNQASWTEPEFAFAEGMQKYWGNLAVNEYPGTENINGKSTEWVEYSTPDSLTMVFTVNNTQMIAGYGQTNCDFWNDLGYNWLENN